MSFRWRELLISAILVVSSGGVMAQVTCANYFLNDAVNIAGDTNGTFLPVNVGDVFTFTITAGSATAASWRIVNDDSGAPGSTLVGGGTISGSLIYTVAVAAGGTGIGFYVDSINGTATIQGRCSPGSPVATASIPTLSEWGMIILSVILGIATLLRLRGRQF
ncbi:MAG: IPTL-CTERM sorting domain-containing protein [Microthrixaceae bacterium]